MLADNIHKLLEHHKLQFLPGETGVYLNTILRSLGMNLIYIFIPIYIYNLTFKIEAAFWYFAVFHLAVILSVLPIGFITTKIGTDWAGFIGGLLRGLFIFFLLLGKENPVFLLYSAVFYGIAIPFSWMSYHYSVVGAEQEDGLFGKETSWIKIWEQITGSISPVHGRFNYCQLRL
jgi:predicted MFS family arabinose efflux permease